MYNVLTDPLITVRSTSGTLHNCSLPDLLVLLARNEVEAFPHLRPHQSHPWHAFLVQMACIACWPGDNTAPAALPADADGWRKALRALTPRYARDEPWHLVVDEVAQPAFMQPPVEDGPLDQWNPVMTPDELDVLIASKNHGIKQRVMHKCSVDDWLFALISLQTHGGYDGKGHQSIIRQNGGAASRPGFSLVSTPLPGGQWKRDTEVILDNTGSFPDYYTNPRVALLWLEPWDGNKGLAIEELHPLFIEICRRIRLTGERATLRAMRKGTKCTRVAAKKMKGNVGDPWIPIHVTEYKAFNTAPTYANLSELLGGGSLQIPLLLQQHQQDPDTGLSLQCRVLVRGQNKTEGYRERSIPIKGKVDWLKQGTTGEVAQKMVDMAKDAEWKVLKPALLEYVCADRAKQTTDWLERWTDALDDAVDEAFFPALWQVLATVDAGQTPEDALDIWRNTLRQLAEKQLVAGLRSLPQGGLKAEAGAWLKFACLCNRWLRLCRRHNISEKESA